MALWKRFSKVALAWAVANPAKTAELAIALTILGVTLAATGRVDRRALKRLARAFF